MPDASDFQSRVRRVSDLRARRRVPLAECKRRIQRSGGKTDGLTLRVAIVLHRLRRRSMHLCEPQCPAVCLRVLPVGQKCASARNRIHECEAISLVADLCVYCAFHQLSGAGRARHGCAAGTAAQPHPHLFYRSPVKSTVLNVYNAKPVSFTATVDVFLITSFYVITNRMTRPSAYFRSRHFYR